MGDGGHERKKSRRHDQRVRFNSACNETHLVEREVSSASSSSSEFSMITDDIDVNNCDTISLDLSSTHSSEAAYDPNRIPSSIFSSGGANNDWSVASNESLFSIRMGDNSFSRDHGFLVYKAAGELMKLDEVFNLPFTLPPVDEGACGQEDSPPKPENVVSSDLAAACPKEIKFKEDPKIANSVRLSDASTASNTSFAFPILISEDTKNSVSNKIREGAVNKEEDKRVWSRAQQELGERISKKSSPPPPPPPKTRTLTSWFCCFSCCSFRCSMSLK